MSPAELGNGAGALRWFRRGASGSNGFVGRPGCYGLKQLARGGVIAANLTGDGVLWRRNREQARRNGSNQRRELDWLMLE